MRLIKGWFEGQPERSDWQRKENYMHGGMRKIPWWKNFICYTLDNKADTAILPVQDVLELDNAGRLKYSGHARNA